MKYAFSDVEYRTLSKLYIYIYIYIYIDIGMGQCCRDAAALLTLLTLVGHRDSSAADVWMDRSGL